MSPARASADCCPRCDGSRRCLSVPRICAVNGSGKAKASRDDVHSSSPNLQGTKGTLYMMQRLLFSILALVLSAGVSQATPVGAVAFTDPMISPGISEGGVTDGWVFNVLTPISVTHLGFYDAGNDLSLGDPAGDGFLESHEVAIWTDAGVLITSAIVNPGAPLEADLFRYVSILPVVLGVGTYRIGGYRIHDDSRTDVAAFSTLPEIAFLGPAFTDPGGFPFAFPNNTEGDLLTPGIFGPSFKVEIAAVPEPATTALSLIALGGLLMFRRRGRRA
jgi:hypothetical protein